LSASSTEVRGKYLYLHVLRGKPRCPSDALDTGKDTSYSRPAGRRKRKAVLVAIFGFAGASLFILLAVVGAGDKSSLAVGSTGRVGK